MRDYQPDVSQILALYQQLEDDILSSMTKRMLKMGYVSDSTRYEAEILQAAGLLREDIISAIAQRTDASTQQVKALFEDAGVRTVEIGNEIHAQAGRVPIDIRQDEGMRQILEETYRKTNGMMRNLTGTTVGQAEQQFISACDRAYMQVSSGAFSYQQAVMTVLKSFADVGAEVVYPSGHKDKLDVAIRRAVRTGVGQATAAISLKHAEDAGCYLMELTAHSGARPEHAEWQGQLVSRTGKNVGKTIDGLHVYSLEQIGYGTGKGFKGWNCRHNWYPYYEGLSTPNYTKQQIAALNAKNIPYNGQMYSEYEISQMQRAAERKIRKLKRRLVTAQEAVSNAPDDQTRESAQNYYNKNARKLKEAEAQYKDFCNQTGQRPDNSRTQTGNFGRSEAQKAVWANKKSSNKANSSSLDASDKSFFDKIKDALLGKKGYEEALNQFSEKLPNMQNRTASAIFERVYKATEFKKSEKNKNYFNSGDGKVYLKPNVSPSTLAHELFHKVDFDNDIVKNGLLDVCIRNDYENLKKMAESTGQTLEDMLYLKYPEAFEREGRMKDSFRGVSDIIHGMTNGHIKLGYGHDKGDSYWKKSNALQKETFAQYGRFYFDENSDVLRIITEIFPETTKQMDSILKILSLYGA